MTTQVFDLGTCSRGVPRNSTDLRSVVRQLVRQTQDRSLPGEASSSGYTHGPLFSPRQPDGSAESCHFHGRLTIPGSWRRPRPHHRGSRRALLMSLGISSSLIRRTLASRSGRSAYRPTPANPSGRRRAVGRGFAPCWQPSHPPRLTSTASVGRPEHTEDLGDSAVDGSGERLEGHRRVWVFDGRCGSF